MSVPIHKLKNKQRQQHNNQRGPGGRQNNNNNNNGGGGGRGGHNNGGRGGRGGGGGGRGNNNNNNHNRNQAPGETRDVLKTMLKLVFEKQQGVMYNNNVLQLVSFRDCPDLASVKRSIDFDTTGFCDSLCAVIAESLPDVQFLQLDQNGIKSMNTLMDSLIKHNLHMVVRGISATQNKIHDLSFINKLARFKNLVEVCFSGNPIAEKGDYKTRLIKRLPQLMGIDGGPVERRPLTLPWPLAAQYDESQQGVLQWLEQVLFGLGTQGSDAFGFSYAVSALFSVNLPVDLPFSYKSNAKAVHNGVTELRAKLREHNRNMVQVTGNTSSKVAQGRSEVCVTLTNCVYPRGFEVRHILDSNADVQFINGADGVLPSMVVVTIHGLMSWYHPDLRIDESNPNGDRPLTFCFDRSFVLVQEQDWSIISDMLTFRERADAAIFMGNSPMRVGPLSTKSGLPPEVVQAILNASSDDVGLTQAMNEVAAVGPDILNECSVATDNPTVAIHMARVIARTNVTTEAALHVVMGSGGDLDAATAQAQQLPPEAYRA